MPRGRDKETMNEIGKNTRFSGKTAAEAAAKSAEARKAYSSAREALKDYMDEDKYREIMDALMKRGKAGNLTAIDMIFKYTESKENTPGTAEDDEDEHGVVLIPGRTDGDA